MSAEFPEPEVDDKVFVEVAPSVPFEDTEEPSKSFEVTAPIGDLAALSEQIGEALGQPVQAVCSYPHGFETPVDEEHPATLYLQAAEDFDGRTVRGVLQTHAKKIEESQKASEEVQEKVAPLREKLLGGEDLTMAEMNDVLRHLLA